MTEQKCTYETVTKDKEALTNFLGLVMDAIKQEEVKRVNTNTKTTYGVLKKECIV